MFRQTDPITSAKAAAEYVASGKLSERRAQVFWLVSEYPNRTHGELAALMYQHFPGLGFLSCAETPHKRLKELRTLGWVFVSGIRLCTETGKEARTWITDKTKEISH